MISTAFQEPGTLADALTQPFCLPQSLVLKDTALVVSSFMLEEGWKAEVALLSMHFVSFSEIGLPIKKSSGVGIVFTGVYAGIQTLNEHTGRPIVYVGTELPGYTDSNPFAHRFIYAPGVYTVLVVNNCTNLDAQVAVSGLIKFSRI